MTDDTLVKCIAQALQGWTVYKQCNAKFEQQVLSELLSVLFVQALLPEDNRVPYHDLLAEISTRALWTNTHAR